MDVADPERSVLCEIAPQAKLVCGIIATQDSIPEAEAALAGAFGEIDHRSEIIPFRFSDYYLKEMGSDLSRRWVSFTRSFSQPELVRTKLKAIGLERGFAGPDGRRSVNLDPGYLTGSKLVLASTKNFSHRIYLWGGIFAEVTLVFEHGSFVPLRWTYPDYRTELAIGYFNQVRGDFLRAEKGDT
jgi:hypothetical protein